MNVDEAKTIFAKYLHDNNSQLTIDDYDAQTYNEDAVIFSRQATERPNTPYMVRNGEVVSINFALTTIEEAYSRLA